MRLLKSFSVLGLAGLTAACTGAGAGYQPVIDGGVGPNYSSDLSACQSLASQQGVFDKNTPATAATGAAVAGGATAVFNNKGTNVRDAALIGAAAGAAAGAIEQQSHKEMIVRNCMRQRGYNVVG
ncbi:MAG: glycine zipper family protein [Tropicimonas sp.]|uniref:glycine zipper family protein n=1 Tax=Tropicimonas sp. TaxID=2067044 RepID=UPI003A8752F1